MQDKIVIKGAREHNLKNINLELPRNKMIVFTGLSGSGKSSLAFDTIFAEGQRRYIESLSAYARQFLGGMQKPDVDEIDGLSPAISIDQKAHSANPRSTVATITEIYDYLRVLYARVGVPYCPLCGTKIEKMTVDQMVERIIQHLTPNPPRRNVGAGSGLSEIVILAPMVRGRKGEYYQMLYDVYNSGFAEARVDGKMRSLREQLILERNKKHTIEVVVDKLQIPNPKSQINPNDQNSKLDRQRLAEALETAIDISNGLATIIFPDGAEQIFSTLYSCPNDGYSFPEIEPRLFSFNSPYGYCEACTGLGTESLFSEKECPRCHGKRLNDNALNVRIAGKNIWEVTSMMIADAREFIAELDLGLSEKEREISGVVLREITNRLQFMYNVGLHYLTLNRKAGTLSGGEAQRIRLASQVGTRLVGALYVLDEPTIGLHQKDNAQLVSTLRNLCDIGNTIIIVEHDEDTILASDWVVDIGPGAGKHGGEIVYSGPLKEILNPAVSLRGLAQAGPWSRSERDPRLRSGQSPSIKGNPTEIAGNPPPRRAFGETGHVSRVLGFLGMTQIKGDPFSSLTGKYLRRELRIEEPDKRRHVDPRATPKIKIKKASEHNLKKINVEIPLRRFVCLTGVSGSGKSTLMYDILYRALANRLYHTRQAVGAHEGLVGSEYIDKVVIIDQSPIGRTSRSNPATYTKAFDFIRELFAATAEARIRGFKPGRFSFNVPAASAKATAGQGGGRCEHCEGKGVLEIEMHFLPSVRIVCDVCKGKRFTQETLQVHYKGKNIADVLGMTVEDAEEFFKDIPFIYDKLKILNEVGLDYLTLGQAATTLSGGEAQRIKLSRELAKRGTTKTMYLLDEPTTGLHYEDVKKLINVLQRLVSQGNTVMVIEHNLDVLKCADWIIDLGPEGGDKGGEIVAEGTPEEVARKAGSFTGEYLKRVLK